MKKINERIQVISNSCCNPFNHRYENKNVLIKDQGLERIGITLGEDCWIGSNCSILGGTKLGKGCVVGAGSVSIVNKELSFIRFKIAR